VQRRNRQRELLRTTRQSRPSHKPRQVDRQCQILPSSKNLLLLRFLLLLLPLLPPLASLHLLRLLPRQLFLRPRNPNQSNSPNNLNKLLLLFLLLLLLKSYDVPSFNIPLKLDLSDTSGKDTMPLYSLRELTSTIRPTGLRPLLRTTIQGSSPNLSHLLVVFRQVPTPPRLDTDPSRILIQSQSTVDNASVFLQERFYLLVLPSLPSLQLWPLRLPPFARPSIVHLRLCEACLPIRKSMQFESSFREYKYPRSFVHTPSSAPQVYLVLTLYDQ